MSRAYRIRVRESLRRTLRAEDKVQSDLELLDILPADAMANLLRRELKNRGFEEKGPALVRKQGNVVVSVDPVQGTITVSAAKAQELEIEADREGRGYVDRDSEKTLKKKLLGELREELARQADQKEETLQKQLTDELEAQLGDLRQELDQVVNRVTAEALKQKAAQLGSIKQMTEDPEAGSLTIVLEV